MSIRSILEVVLGCMNPAVEAHSSAEVTLGRSEAYRRSEAELLDID